MFSRLRIDGGSVAQWKTPSNESLLNDVWLCHSGHSINFSRTLVSILHDAFLMKFVQCHVNIRWFDTTLVTDGRWWELERWLLIPFTESRRSGWLSPISSAPPQTTFLLRIQCPTFCRATCGTIPKCQQCSAQSSQVLNGFSLQNTNIAPLCWKSGSEPTCSPLLQKTWDVKLFCLVKGFHSHGILFLVLLHYAHTCVRFSVVWIESSNKVKVSNRFNW